MILKFIINIDEEETIDMNIKSLEIMHDINNIIKDYMNGQKLPATISAQDISDK